MDFEKIFNSNIQKAIIDFESIYSSFEKKISFIKAIELDNDFLNNHPNKQILEQIMNLLVENAKVTETRKMQQKYLMPVLVPLLQNEPCEKILDIFQNDNKTFTMFCIVLLAFRFENSIKEHADTHHKNIIEALNKYALAISKINIK